MASAEKTATKLAATIIQMTDLMYQLNTKKRFLDVLYDNIGDEIVRVNREMDKRK